MLRRASLMIALCIASAVAAHGMSAGRPFSPAGRAVVPVLYLNTDFLAANAGKALLSTNICWANPQNTPGATPAERAAWRDARRRTVEEWSRYARVNFYGWDGPDPVNHPTVCANGAPGVHIVICNMPQDERCPALPNSQSAPGGYVKANGVSNGVRLNPQHDAGTLAHEVGHILGFYHEEERADAPPIESGPCKKQSWPNSKPQRIGGYDKTGVMSYCMTATAAPWLSPNDIASIELLYGRRKNHSLLTPRAHCAGAPDDARNGVTLSDCDEKAGQEWSAVTTWSKGDAWHLRLNTPANAGPKAEPKCLAAASATASADVALASCAAGTEWRLQNVFIRGFGGLCLDLPGGQRAPGTPIQTWTCGAPGKTNQHWTRTRIGQIRYGTTAMCAAIAPAGELQLAPCNADDDTQKFDFADSAIRRTSSGKCLQVNGPSNAEYASGSGLPAIAAHIVEAACNGSLIQRFNFTGALRYDATPNLCLTRKVDAKGETLSLADCDNNPETQVWDYRF